MIYDVKERDTPLFVYKRGRDLHENEYILIMGLIILQKNCVGRHGISFLL